MKIYQNTDTALQITVKDSKTTRQHGWADTFCHFQLFDKHFQEFAKQRYGVAPTKITLFLYFFFGNYCISSIFVGLTDLTDCRNDPHEELLM